MKKLSTLLIVIVIAVLALMLTACGGDSAGSSSSTTATPSPGSTATTGGGAPAPAAAKVKQLKVPRKFKADEKTPRFFVEALKKKEPILINFYNKGDVVSKEVLAQIKPVYKKYDGTVTFLQLKSDLNARVSDLADQFQVGFIPYTAVLNRDGEIIFEKTGYVDSKVVEQAVYNAVNK